LRTGKIEAGFDHLRALGVYEGVMEEEKKRIGIREG
jgi:hypothetical protein